MRLECVTTPTLLLILSRQIGYITCDNASNNGTMLAQFAERIKTATGVDFDREERHVRCATVRAPNFVHIISCPHRCLAHIINLATQALLTTYSKSKHYDPTNPDGDLAIGSGVRRNEVGLVRTLKVPDRCSAVLM